MTVYLILMLLLIITGICCFAKKNTKRRTNIFCNITIVLMVLVQCLRAADIGEDTPAYIEWFKEYTQITTITNLFHPWRDIEIGYSILNIVLSRITHNERVLICVVSIIIVVLHIKFIQNNSKNPFLSVLLFLGCNFFLTSMVSWRQFIAMGIVFWIYPLLLQKKYFKALIVLLISLCFHDTAIIFGFVMLIVILLSKFHKSSLFILIVCLIFIALLDTIINIILKILPAYQFYFNIDIDFGTGKLRIVYMLIELCLMLFVVCNKKKYGTKKFTILSSIMAMAIFSGMLSLFIPHMFRLSYYFDYFLLILVPELVPTKSRNEMLILICCVILYVYYLANNPGNTVPYKFCF